MLRLLGRVKQNQANQANQAVPVLELEHVPELVLVLDPVPEEDSCRRLPGDQAAAAAA